jgi:F0F1-type ATP synthase delta subunit
LTISQTKLSRASLIARKKKMNQLSQSDQLTQETKISFLWETFSDYGLQAILSELIDFILEKYLDEFHCGILEDYLLPAKNSVTVRTNRDDLRLEMNYPDFTNVEEING